MHYSQAGGRGTPGGGAPGRHGRRRDSAVLTDLAFGVWIPAPAGTPAQLAAVRHALSVWQVNTVVIATDPAALDVGSRGRTPSTRRPS